jgi:hypothetical protein
MKLEEPENLPPVLSHTDKEIHKYAKLVSAGYMATQQFEGKDGVTMHVSSDDAGVVKAEVRDVGGHALRQGRKGLGQKEPSIFEFKP